MMTLQDEALFNDLSVKIESVTDQFKLWTRFDTIWCLESTVEKKDGILKITSDRSGGVFIYNERTYPLKENETISVSVFI